MERILISWIGSHDLDAVNGDQPGPIFAAIDDAITEGRPYKAFHFLYNYSDQEVSPYRDWLSNKGLSDVSISYQRVHLSSPSAYAEIYPAAERALEDIDERCPEFQRTVHLSPGTAAMAAVWILLVKTRFPSHCIESWFDKVTGRQYVNSVELPFEIDARFTREATARADVRLEKLHVSEAQDHRAFSKISSDGGLSEALQKARKMATRDVPVLLLGETGTGKELFSRAIHEASSRKDGKFIAVNCGALPKELAESLLFGHKKGAFTGAHQDHTGYFAQANGGTLFLDEVGELSPDMQVKLLRVLQEKSFTQVGGTEIQESDFRLIAATHRNLMDRVVEGVFREDLFYRLAVGVIKLPALRERPQDLGHLVEALMEGINDELADQTNYQRKKIDGDVIKVITSHDWPGNIRELRATLLRAAVWEDSQVLTAEAIHEAILKLPKTRSSLLADDIIQPIDLNKLMDDVARHYIPMALKKTGGNKTRAAELLGLKSHQVLSKKIEKLGLE